MSNFFIDRPIFATVLAILITLAGGIAFLSLPVARFPQITPPQIQVTTTFPGADARTIEQSVAAPLEQVVNGVPNMIYMDSKSSTDGSYTLGVSFEVGTNQDIAAVDVANQVAIAQRSLPADVIRQGVAISKRQPQALVYIAIRATDPRYDYLFLSNFATLQIYDSLARIPGVGQVQISGARDYGMRIWLDPGKMSRLGITTQDITNALNDQNVVAPAGTVGGEPAPPGTQSTYTVTVQGRLETVREYERIVLRSGANGSLVRLADVARIELAATDYNRSSRENGQPIALLAVYALPDANGLEVGEAVRRTMVSLQSRFPPGVVYDIPLDTTLFVSQSIREVEITFFIAAALVLLVVFVFLENWRATLIPMLAVPVSLVGSFALFLAFGFSINTLTLFALVLAIGLVVDDAIVVVEAVTEKMQSHRMNARDATRAAMADVSNPVIAIALVLVAVFVPVAFLGGLTGQFYRQFALTLSVSVLISALVALTFTPAMCAILLRPPSESETPRWLRPGFATFGRGFEWVRGRYVDWVARQALRPKLFAVGFALLVVATLALVLTRPAGFIPEDDQGYLQYVAQLPAGASVQRTEQVQSQIRELLLKQPEVETEVGISGFNLLVQVALPYAGSGFVVLRPWGERGKRGSVQNLAERLNRDARSIPEANILFIVPPAVPGIGSAGGVELVLADTTGGSLERFNEVAEDFVGQASRLPAFSRVAMQYNSNVPQIEAKVDRDRAQELGIPISDIFGTLQTFLGGNYINDFNLFGRTYHVTAEAEGDARTRPEAINNLYVRARAGDMVPLSALVTLRQVPGPAYLERYDVYRAVTLNGVPAPGHSQGEAIAALEQLARGLPEGFTTFWTGSVFQQKKSGGQAPYIFAMALGFVFLLLAALYESWVVPFAVILCIPLAVFGAFVGLSSRGMADDIYAQVGLVMLIGLAAKNAILIVEFAKVGHERGLPVLQAALEAARLRFRPIVMTSLAFILGAFPLAIASGAGASSREVLGTTVVFGMSAATLFGVFAVPMFYLLVQRWANRGRPAAAVTPVPATKAEGMR